MVVSNPLDLVLFVIIFVEQLAVLVFLKRYFRLYYLIDLQCVHTVQYEASFGGL